MRPEICSGCGEQAPLTKEHLISLPLGKVIQRDNELTTAEMRRRLPKDFMRIGDDGHPDESREPDMRLDGSINNLLCASCNQGWAIDLEELVGPMLYDYLHLKGRLTDVNAVKRWMAFHAIKTALYYKRTEWLGETGAYHTLLGKLSNPTVTVEFPLYVARYDGTMRPPHFVFFANPLLDAWPVLAWMWLHGMFFWLVPPSTTMPSTAHVTEAYDGLRYVKTKTVRKHELKGLMPPTRIQDV